MDSPVACKVLSVEAVGPNLFSMVCSWEKKRAAPGQFVMVWIPGVDEIPMSIYLIEKNRIGFTFRVVGDATKALSLIKTGAYIGLRGPYGNGFDLSGYSKILFVGGGTGVGSIVPAVEEFDGETIVVIGAQCEDELICRARLQQANARLLICTDDGSCGQKAWTSDIVKELLASESFDCVVMCGPEVMMKKIFELCTAHEVNVQASLERFMKCAVGVCGQCCVGKGVRVCADGPVFDSSQLSSFEDFGLFTRDACGRKVKI